MDFPFFHIIRLQRWWLYKASPLLGIAYLVIFIQQISFQVAAYLLLLFIIALTGIAGLGYFINDFFDREKDVASGKSNLLATLGTGRITLVLLALIVLSVLPWWYLPHPVLIIILIVVQLLLFFSYSHPALRFKEKPIWDVLSDALYGHAFPFLITVMVFYDSGEKQHGAVTHPGGDFRYFSLFLVLAVAWQLVKGLRNILLHQIDDRKNDRKTGIQTLVLKKGPMKIVNCMNHAILPFELVLFISVLIVLSFNIPLFYCSFFIFLAWSFMYFSIYRLGAIPTRQFRVKFLFFLNDFYEMWLPLTATVYLAFHDARFMVLLPAHLVLFHQIPVKFKNDLKVILENLKVAFRKT